MNGILSPCDLPSLAPGADVRLGGRVVAREGSTAMVADAWDRVRVVGLDATVGDYVVLRGVLGPEEVTATATEAVYPAPLPEGADWRRFAEGGAERLARRAEVVAHVRRFFTRRGYLEVDTPLLVPSPGLDLHLDPFSLDPSQRTRARAHLVTSPEYQMKRLVAGGVPRAVQIGRCFRRDEEGQRHLPEFAMVEWYRAFASMEAMIDETEALVAGVLDAFAPPRQPLLEVSCSVEPPFHRMTVAEAFARFADLDRAASTALLERDETRWFEVLITRVEPCLARLGRPVFLTHYPAPLASLARLSPDDPTVAERFELYVGDVELCNGFGELVDPVEQRTRLEADRLARRQLGRPVYPIDEAFLGALEAGMPPTAGNALGLDRLVALALGARSLDEVVAFGTNL